MNKIVNDIKLDFTDVLMLPQFSESGIDTSSRSLVNLDKHLVTSNFRTLKGPGIIAANMDGVGTIEVATALRKYNIYTALHKNYDENVLIDFFQKNEHVSQYSFYSMGINSTDYDKFKKVKSKVTVDKICIDVANGYMNKFYDFIAKIRDENPEAVIMAGNVVTPEAVIRAHSAGVDIIKMGIGPGAMCTTRLVTGIGYPQLSCILDSVQAADEYDILLCSDGGCSQPAHVAIAMAAGADMVMLGTMLAGTDEGGGTVVDGKVMFYGMSSKTANDKHFGGLKDYRSSEGRTTMIPYKGSMDNVIKPILGGLASACTYNGILELDQLSQVAKFIRVNNTHNRAYENYTIGN